MGTLKISMTIDQYFDACTTEFLQDIFDNDKRQQEHTNYFRDAMFLYLPVIIHNTSQENIEFIRSRYAIVFSQLSYMMVCAEEIFCITQMSYTYIHHLVDRILEARGLTPSKDWAKDQ